MSDIHLVVGRVGEFITVGDHGVAVAANNGAAHAGIGGVAIAGDNGAARAGNGGIAVVGAYGSAIVGNGGRAAAGEHGEVQIGDVIGYVGRGDIEPNVLYRLDIDDKFKRVAE